MSEEQYELAEPSAPKAVPSVNLPEVVVELIGTIEDVPAGTIKNALVKLSITDVALASTKATVLEAISKYDGTKASYEAVKRARLDVVPKRTAVKKEAEEGRAEAIAVQKLWIGAEKTVTGFYADLEALCAAKEFDFTEKLRKEAEEKERIERERVRVLYDQLKAYDWPGNELICAQYTQEQFESELAKSKANWEAVQAGKRAEAEKLEREAKERAEADERNRAEAERLRVEGEKQRAEQARIDAERHELERQRLAGLKEIEDAKLKAQAEENARLAEANRKEQERLKAERDAIDAQKAEEDRKKHEAEEVARLADLAPDKEKIRLFAERVETEVRSAAPSIGDLTLCGLFDSLVDDLRSTLDRIKALS